MTTHEIIEGTEDALLSPVKQEHTFMHSAMKKVEALLFDVVNSDVTTLRDASRHILEAGGKRIRPRLVLLSYAAAGGQDDDAIAPVAAAIELVHTASVVHDDINDHGVVRRGRPSVNSIWGRTFALLTGDFLFTKVYELMAPYKDLNIIFAEATVALVEGETLQASAVKENNLSREVYYEIIARKTAALFKAGAVLGGKLAGADEDILQALGRYGYNIGLAFQIIDDILDLTGDEHQLGKTAGIDLQQGKGIAAIGEEDLGTKIKNKLLRGDAIDQGKQQAQHLVDMAVAELIILPQSSEKEALIQLARQVVDRKF